MTSATIVRTNQKKNYSDSVEHNGVVYLRGCTPDDRSGDLADQTRQVLAGLDALLAAAGTSKSALLSATIYLRDIDEREKMNQLWSEWVDSNNVPARATVGVSGLGTSDCRIEISVTAAKLG
ncbi:MAG: RidA family protein [Comamonadaceae bacterium]|nr:MAG: RidA family protein [Comamonadaceae bacterium]